MSFRNLSLAVLAITALSACSSNKDDANRLAAAPALEEGASDVGSYSAGVPNYTFTVDHGSILVDGAAVDSIDNAMFDGYPSLAKHTAAVGSVTKAIETKENALELYAGEELLMAWDLRGEAPTLAYSRDGFNADSVRYTKTAGSEQDQTLANGEVTFNFNECKVEQEQEQEQGKVEEKVEEKGQEQEQGKVEEKGKVIDQAQGFVGSEEQEQGKVEEKGQEQAPKEQEQGKVEEKAKEVCKTVEMKLNLREIAVEKKQEQEQGKVEEKGQEQEQGKVEEKVEEKGQEQEQGKVEEKVEEKGQEQAPKEQEQGKVEEKGQEQAPKEQEQGKSQEQAQKR